MAVITVPQSSTLVVKVQTGLNASGNPVYRNLNFSNVKPSAADADVYAVGLGFAGLQTYPAVNLVRVDTGNLVSQ